MKKFFAIVFIFIFLATLAMAEPATVKVKSGHLNMRKYADKDADVVGKLENGTVLEVKRERYNPYCAVLSGQSVIGYVSKQYLVFEEKESFPILKFRVLENCIAKSDVKGDTVKVRDLQQGEMVEGRISSSEHLHLLGGGFVPLAYLEEIKE